MEALDTTVPDRIFLNARAFDANPLVNADPAPADGTAFRSGTLQGAHLMIVARALELDCAPQAGFDNAKADAEFPPTAAGRAIS